MQLSVAVRNAMLDSIEGAIAASAIMRIRTGPPPAACGAPDTGTVLATLVLPSDWMLDAVGGSKDKSGTWVDNAADAAGIAEHFRVYNAAGTACHMQGTVTVTDGGGDMTVDNPTFAAGQSFTVTAFTLNSGNG